MARRTPSRAECSRVSAPWLHDRSDNRRFPRPRLRAGLRWEIDRLQRAFLGTGQTWVLLKGAAYVAAGTPAWQRTPRRRHRRHGSARAIWRESNRILCEHGWEIPEMDPYDTSVLPANGCTNSRQWSTVNAGRWSTCIMRFFLRTSRLKPSSERLVGRSSCNGVRVLCPSHMVLHAAAHLFHDGEIAGAIRDLVDLDQLFRWFGRDKAFWSDFGDEALALNLTRPAYYAIRYSREVFGTPIDEDVAAKTVDWGPAGIVRHVMDALVERSIAANSRIASSSSAFALYVRSHWLRMPPHQLIRHLTRKAFRHAEPTNP